jgi:DNA-binding CsgD family transcriptional regulator
MSPSGSTEALYQRQLFCMFSISELVNYFEDDLESIIQGMLELIPGAWQYPRDARVSISLDSKIYASGGSPSDVSRIESVVTYEGRKIGWIRVIYLHEHPPEYEGPFLKEERLLLNALAEHLGRIIERIRGKEQLEIQRRSLDSKNAALSEVLSQAKEESGRKAQAVQQNIDALVLPILDTLESRLAGSSHAVTLKLLRENLLDIASPLYSHLAHNLGNLSPKEHLICNMISKGLSSKEIAAVENLSPATVYRHRENIREKLGLIKSGTNLERFLQQNSRNEG